MKGSVLLMWLVHANLFKENKEFTRVSDIANLPRTWQFHRIGKGWKLVKYKIKIFGIAGLYQTNKEYSQTVTLDFRAFSLFSMAKRKRPRRESNPQSSDPKSDALYIRPRGQSQEGNFNATHLGKIKTNFL